MGEAERLNADSRAGLLNRAALRQAAGEEWYRRFGETGLFADAAVFIPEAGLQQMQDVIGAAERAISRLEGDEAERSALGVFYGYDFHLNADGAHLIEINTNAGGAFLNALLVDSQRDVVLPGVAAGEERIEQAIIGMFRAEWQRVRGNAPLGMIAILDEQPQAQYLYPEFLLAQRMFERAGIRACIADPADLVATDQGLFFGERRVDLVYNRLTDFSLQQHPALLHAWRKDETVLTPNPDHHARYADKRKLASLTDAGLLHDAGVTDADIAVLQRGIPHTFEVRADLGERLWDERKQLFFKPSSGFGSRGAYRGDKLTRRVFGEIMQSGYVAQRVALPGERRIGEAMLKCDVRCYVYDGNILLAAARLYQGQTTNFRTPGGGFAQVRVVG